MNTRMIASSPDVPAAPTTMHLVDGATWVPLHERRLATTVDGRSGTEPSHAASEPPLLDLSRPGCTRACTQLVRRRSCVASGGGSRVVLTRVMLRHLVFGPLNGSHAKLCGRSRVPKPERRGGCRQ